MPQHSPGPWRLEPSQGGRLYIYAHGDKQPFKPNVYIPKSGGTKQAVANARLMAAAPELLNALRCVKALLPENVKVKVEELIQKAEGL